VLLFDEVELLDVASLMQVTSAAGQRYNYRPFRLLPTARTPGWIETRSQLRIEARYSLESCPTPELLFVPGGYGARRAAADAELVAFCQRAAASAQLVVAIGAGLSLLGAAGLLEGATVAGNAELAKWLPGSLPRTRFDEDEAIVTSLESKLLTAASSGCGVELGLAVVARCLGERTASALRVSLGVPSLARLEPSPVTITLAPR
jgi:transcriptional regulator GlxA family with amidase domain